MISIPRAAPDDPWLKKAPCWRPARLENGQRTATMSCPNGHAASLSQHTIHDDGRVEPSVECPDGGRYSPDQQYACPKCSFHDYVTLEGWSRT